jgi:hypothetical protein
VQRCTCLNLTASYFLLVHLHNRMQYLTGCSRRFAMSKRQFSTKNATVVSFVAARTYQKRRVAFSCLAGGCDRMHVPSELGNADVSGGQNKWHIGIPLCTLVVSGGTYKAGRGCATCFDYCMATTAIFFPNVACTRACWKSIMSIANMTISRYMILHYR